MDKRNLSRNSKSEKEKNALRAFVKGLGSDDTSPPDSPFDPSNSSSKEKILKKSTAKRPKSFWKKITTHVKKNLAAYICLIVGGVFIPLIIVLVIVPTFNINREIGETKTEVKEVKSQTQKNGADIENLRTEFNVTKGEIQTTKVLLNESTRKSESYLAKFTDLLKKVESIKTFLVNRFNAKID